MDNLGYLFAAYTVTWAALFVYLLTLGRRLKRLEDEARERPDEEAGSR